jgi:hypothetical protein
MAQISKAERERRERINKAGIRAIHKALDKAAIDSGDPAAFRKRRGHARMVEEALGTWEPPAMRVASEAGEAAT